MHRLLRRQLKKHLGVEDEVPAALQRFVAAIDAAYADFDSDRALLERSQELSSRELSEARDKATEAQRRLTDALESISEGFSLYDADDRLVIYNRRYRDMHGTGSIDVVNQGVSFETILRNTATSGEIRDAEGTSRPGSRNVWPGIVIPRARMCNAAPTGAGSRSTSAKPTKVARSRPTLTSPT